MMHWKVTAFTILPGHRLEVTFADGLRGVADLSKESFDGLFAPLADPDYFARAELHNGVITWPNGADLAPDALYDDVRRAVGNAAQK